MTTYKKAIRSLLWGLGLSAMAQVASAQLVDLVANNNGPTTANAGDPFVYTLTLTNNGPNDAIGATFVDTMPAGATNVAAVCDTAASTAACPPTMTVGNTQISGTLPNLTNQGTVVIKITGNYGVPSDSSVRSAATIYPPSGNLNDDAIPKTNFSPVNTTLINDAKVQVVKTQSPANPVIGDTITYTITVSNAGGAAADGTKLSDSIMGLGSGGGVQVHLQYASCTTSNDAQCPAASLFPSPTITLAPSTSMTLFRDVVIPKLPANSSMVLTYTMTATASTQCGLGTGMIQNYVSVATPSGITNTSPSADTSSTATIANIPATPACPLGVMGITKTQSPSVYTPGTPMTYTILLVNNGPDADNTRLTDAVNAFGGAAGYATMRSTFVSCTQRDGAVCPAASAFASVNGRPADLSSNGVVGLFSVVIPKFPSGSSLEIKYTVDLTESTLCGKAASDFGNSATWFAPAGMVGQGNSQSVSVRLPKTPDCPLADLQIIKTQSTNVPVLGQPYEYKVTVTNNGPADASGALWGDTMSATGFGTEFRFLVDFVSCEPAAGATCPADNSFREFTTSPVQANALVLFRKTPIPKFPAGSSVTLTYKITPSLVSTSCSLATGSINNSTQVEAADGVFAMQGAPTIRTASVTMPVECADVAIRKTVAPVMVQAGQEVVFSIDVTNSGAGDARNVVMSDPLPPMFKFVTATCKVVKAPATCGPSVDYDSATHTVSSTIDVVGKLGGVQFEVKGTAGPTPGSYDNVAWALIPPGLIDPNMKTNDSQANVQIINQQSPITVRKLLAGLPASGLPAAMQFSGTVTCGAQAPQNWTVTVPAGGTSAVSTPPLLFWDSELCTVTEDTPPTAPAGYDWVGTPTIANPSTPLGPATALTVAVTNTLQRQTASVTLTKLISGPAAGQSQVNGSFNFVLDCGVDGSFPAAITVAGGASSSVTVPNLPVGASCVVTEPGRAAAPAGYDWDAPVIATSPVIIPAQGGTATVTVTNPLKRLNSALTITKAISGAAAGVAQVNASFAFKLDCGADGQFSTQVAVVNGATASSVVSGVPAGASCTVTETPGATAPQGYTWDTPVFDKNPVVVPATGAAVTVLATNPLKRSLGSLALTKQFAGPADALQKVNGKFVFALNCGADGSFNTEVLVSNGQAATATVKDLPVGASCQVAETDSAAAPAGFGWAAPLYETNPVVVLGDGSVATFKVTNTLNAGSTEPAKVPTLNAAMLLALMGVMAALGMARTRRQRKH